MNKKRFLVAIVASFAVEACLVAALYHRFGAYRETPVSNPYRGEVRPYGDDVTLPGSLFGKASLSNDGRRFVVLAEGKDHTNGESKQRFLLWEESTGLTELATIAQVGGGPVLSGDGRRAYLIASLSGENFNSDRSLIMWEEGIGVAALQIKVSGEYSLSVDETGNRVVGIPTGTGELQSDEERLNHSVSLRGLTIAGPFVFRLYPDSKLGRMNRVEIGGERPYYEIMSLPDSALPGGVDAFFPARAKSSLTGGVLSLNTSGGQSKLGRTLTPLPVPRFNLDFNQDGAADIVTYYGVGSSAFFRVLHTNGFDGSTRNPSGVRGALVSYRVGDNGAIPVIGDYNGDGLPDLATFLPNVGVGAQFGSYDRNWKIFFSAPENYGPGRYSAADRSRELAWGYGDTVAVPGDYDGDGVTDPAVFVRPTAIWSVMLSGGGFNAWKAQLSLKNFGFDLQWGIVGDRPIVADINGDGRVDPTVIRFPSAAPAGDEANPERNRYEWITRISTEDGKVEGRRMRFGTTGDIPLVGRFLCDNRSIPAVFRPSKGNWYVRRGKDDIAEIHFDVANAEPFVGDFDGDGCDDLAFFNDKEFPFYHFYNWKLAEELKTKAGFPSAESTLRYGAADEPPAQVLLRRHQQRLDEYAVK